MTKSKSSTHPIGSIESLVGVPALAGNVQGGLLEPSVKSKYREYLDLCDKLNLIPLTKEDLWEDHRDEINQAIDYKGYYP